MSAAPRTAVIIKGNPKFIAANPQADRFYAAVAAALQAAGYSTTFDAGEPFTEPPPADVWVGHSRGADRLRFAPPGTRTIALGSNSVGAINHPDDDVETPYHLVGGAPPVAHFELTPEMAAAVTSNTHTQEKEAALLPDVVLQPHQQRVADEAARGPIRKLLYFGLGSGKSLASLAAMEARDEPYSAVVPAALRPNYRSEAEKFTDRTTPLPVNSYTGLALGDQPPPGNLVFDEVQRLRSPASAQTQAAIAAAEKAKSLLLLSGTPVVNRPGDLAVPLQLLTGKKMSPDEFEGRYTGTRRTYPSILHRLIGWSSGSEPTLRRRRELEALLAGHVDYYAPASPTVPVSYEDHAVDMSEPQVQLYRGMLDQLPHHLKQQLRSSVDPAEADLPRLMAFLTGPRQVGLSTLPFRRDKDPLKAFEQSPKLQAAMGKMTERLADPRTKALVFSNFIDAGLTPYAAALAQAGVPHAVFHGGLSDAERKKLVADYNSGATRVALIGPSGTEGLSFKGTQLIQLLDPHWQPTRSDQAIGRGLRFDSHTGLPEDLRHVTVQRFASRLPAGVAGRLARATGFGQPEVDRRLTAMSDRKTRANRLILDLLQRVGTPKAAGVLDDLKRAKTESDRKNYPAKHEILRRLMKKSPADFAVDARGGHAVGVTHAPTGFRFHLPATAVPGDLA